MRSGMVLLARWTATGRGCKRQVEWDEEAQAGTPESSWFSIIDYLHKRRAIAVGDDAINDSMGCGPSWVFSQHTIAARDGPPSCVRSRGRMGTGQGESFESEPIEWMGNRGYQARLCSRMHKSSRLISAPPMPWLCSKPMPFCHTIITTVRPYTSVACG